MNKSLISLLEEIKEEILDLKEGQFLETIRSIYPSTDTPRGEKNILIKNKELTKPLALSKKDKKRALTENSPVYDFYKEKKRGDILRIKSINGDKLICENLSFEDDIKDKFYKDIEVHLTLNDLVEGNVKRLFKGVHKIVKIDDR